MDLEKYIRAYALKNAIEHGQAQPGRILPKLFQHGLEKSEIKNTLPKINEIIKEVNNLSKEEQESQFKELEKLIPEKQEESHELPELKDPKNVVMRFEPSPSGPLHVGHAYVLALNNKYVKKYKGKLILRIGDTNPENIYKPAYKLIEEDVKWLTQSNISKILIQSARLEIYYKYFEKLLELDKVYICDCDQEKYKELLGKSKPCPCRELTKEEQKQRWKKMFKGYKQGEVVARLKTDLNNKNPAMRDFPLFRINDTSHPKQKKKFRVWPLMNMAVTVDDIETKVTHVIRAKDHADNAKRQEIIYSYLKEKPPQALFVGRINFLGMQLSTTQTKEDIEKKKYAGWDDIKLATLLTLKRRGFTPESLTKYALEIGMSLNDKKVEKEEFFKAIEHLNRQIIDPTSNRYSFVQDPVEIKIPNAPEIKEVKVPIHPDKKQTRTIKVNKIFISREDFKKFKGKEIRLLHLYNIKMNKTSEFTSEELKNIPKINWVSEGVKTQVLMPDGKWTKGIAESSIKK